MLAMFCLHITRMRVVCVYRLLSAFVRLFLSLSAFVGLSLSSIVHKLPHCGFMSLSVVVVRLCPSLSDRCLSSSGLLYRAMLEEVYVVIRLACSLERCWTSLCSRGVSYQGLALSADDVATCVICHFSLICILSRPPPPPPDREPGRQPSVSTR